MIFKTLKVQSSRHVLAVLAVSVLFPLPVFAQGNVATFTPVNSWTVGATELSSVRGLKGVRLPCVISNEYDNGYIVRFSGGGNKMLALAIDFRQDVFEQGRKYDAMLTVGDGYVKQVGGSAFTSSTLIFSLRSIPDVYKVLKASNDMSLDIEGNAFKFSLQQLAQNFAALESCYNTGNAAVIPPVSGVQDASIAATNAPAAIIPSVESHALPQSFDEIMKATPSSVAPVNVAQVMPRPTPVTPRPSQISRAVDVAPKLAQQNQWNATAGEDIKTVLQRWSNTAGYDLQWQASDSGNVVQDISLNGSFENAVSQLLAENRAVTGIDGRFNQPDNMTSMPSSATGQWSASAGDSLKSVLDGWASKADAKIVWKSSPSVSLKKTINQSGEFEGAVQAALDQFANDQQRPVGALNIDPVSGKRTLIMDLDR